MRSLLCEFFIGAAVGKLRGMRALPLCLSVACMCAVLVRVELGLLLQPHGAAGMTAYFATCMRVFGTEADRGVSSGEVTDCVIVSKLNNQYSSAC